jgi:drug/metabolite transporter (DMT)-like permease
VSSPPAELKDVGHLEESQAAERVPMGLGACSLTLLTAALWGGTPVAIRFTTDRLPPVMVAAIRFGMAAVFMLGWCRAEGSELRLRSGQLRPIVLLSCLLFLQIATFNVGVAESNSSHGSLFINTFIFWVAAIEHFVTKSERITPRQFAGLLLAGIAALAVVATEGGHAAAAGSASRAEQPTLAGDLILLASGCLLGIKVVYTKYAVRSVEPGKLIFWHDVLGTALFLAYSFLFETTRADSFVLPVVLGLLYQGVVVAGFCFALQAVQLRRYSASQVSVFSAATPLFGIYFGVLFRGDAVSPWLLAAGFCVAVGIWLVTLAPAASTGCGSSVPRIGTDKSADFADDADK